MYSAVFAKRARSLCAPRVDASIRKERAGAINVRQLPALCHRLQRRVDHADLRIEPAERYVSSCEVWRRFCLAVSVIYIRGRILPALHLARPLEPRAVGPR
jgi:hypothetical protein